VTPKLHDLSFQRYQDASLLSLEIRVSQELSCLQEFYFWSSDMCNRPKTQMDRAGIV